MVTSENGRVSARFTAPMGDGQKPPYPVTFRGVRGQQGAQAGAASSLSLTLSLIR